MGDNLDPVSLYFNAIRKTPPLEHKEFVKIWKIFKDGENAKVYLQAQKNRLGSKRKNEIQKCVKEGDKAKTALVIGNLRLVIPIAKRHYRQGIDFIDLIEEGNIGLINALKKFNIRKGFRFSTYASYWIEQSIRRSIQEQSKVIRIPPHAWEALRKWFREWDNLSGQLGRSPTLSEMARRLNLTARQVKGVMEAVEASRGVGSLDLSMDEEDNLSLKDLISDKSKYEPDKVFSVLKLHDEMDSALSKLSIRERDILNMRFGLGGGESATLDEVGKKYKISRERVRQIQERSLDHLKQIAQKMGLS